MVNESTKRRKANWAFRLLFRVQTIRERSRSFFRAKAIKHSWIWWKNRKKSTKFKSLIEQSLKESFFHDQYLFSALGLKFSTSIDFEKIKIGEFILQHEYEQRTGRNHEKLLVLYVKKWFMEKYWSRLRGFMEIFYGLKSVKTLNNWIFGWENIFMAILSE